MPKVHVLDKELSELIAAGEVIERPSSIIKELLENSIDSGATVITAEIKQGGIAYIRVTDNGCGISYSDVPTAFLRHATSKLSAREDLNSIHTLGFRGEALASISAVAKCEIMTKPAEEEYGTRYKIEGTEEKLYEKTGCPDGTTIVIRDIFYNVPARLKFLKKDKYEGNAIASIIGKIAVSHPEISFTFIRDNRREVFTPGDGSLYSSVYSVFGREFAAAQLPVDYSLGGIKVSGFAVKPLFGRRNRAMQHFFVNGRYVKSFTCMGALEEAYRNNIMEGKFPACVLFMDIPPVLVDVNVHPAKIEVRFSDDKAVYDALYFAVKNAILCDDGAARMNLGERKRTEADYAISEFQNPQIAEQTQFADTSVSRFSGSVKAVRAADNGGTVRQGHGVGGDGFGNVPEMSRERDMREAVMGDGSGDRVNGGGNEWGGVSGNVSGNVP
ncbi:MAG: DNA mismatch repair endonuclease MutL, partial [Ruminococcus sp.]|nr:DNA mismatch repair endonuclease MutL [Ruminococcus sp.]